MTTIYSINDGEDSTYYPTKREALKAASAAAADSYDWEGAIEVTENVVADMGKRELLCAMLNGHWAKSVKVVASFTGKKRGAE
jgi:hypothetical protein